MSENLERAVGRIEGKLDTFIAQMAAHDERTTGIEVRTRKLEGKVNWATGAGATFGVIIGAVISSFTKAHG